MGRDVTDFVMQSSVEKKPFYRRRSAFLSTYLMNERVESICMSLSQSHVQIERDNVYCVIFTFVCFNATLTMSLFQV